MDAVEASALITREGGRKVYWRRWYILFVFTLLNMFANYVWLTWSSIQATCQLVYEWKPANVMIIQGIGATASLLAVIPSAWVLDTIGLRETVLASTSLLALGIALEIFTCNNQCKTNLIYIGAVLIGLGAPGVQNTGIVVLSATWFPPNERVTATAVSILVASLGSGCSAIVGPYMVPDVGTANYSYKLGHKININFIRNHTSQDQIQYLKEKITEYLYVQAVVVGFLLLCIWIYFPSKPPKPPSLSSTVSRLDFAKGSRTLLHNKQLLLLMLIFSVSNGVNWGFTAVLDVVLSQVGVDEKSVGWLGVAANALIIPGIFLSRIVECFRNMIKPILVFLFVASASCQAVFSLSCYQIIPLTDTVIFAALLGQVMFFCTTTPLILELAAECSYPVAEGITGGLLTTSVYAINASFFFTFSFQQVKPLWIVWVYTATLVICIPLIFMYHGRSKRLEIDLAGEQFSVSETQHAIN